MSINVKIDTSRMTVGDLLDIEEGFKTNREIIAFLSGFILGEDGQYLDRSAAFEKLKSVPVSELPGITQRIIEQIKGVQEAAVPLGTENA